MMNFNYGCLLLGMMISDWFCVLTVEDSIKCQLSIFSYVQTYYLLGGEFESSISGSDLSVGTSFLK